MKLLKVLEKVLGGGPKQEPIEHPNVQIFRDAAAKGDVTAQYNMGVTYEMGAGGVKKDLTRAAQYYSDAEKQGHVEAGKSLGPIFGTLAFDSRTGRNGSEIDPQMSIAFSLLGAKHGDAQSIVFLQKFLPGILDKTSRHTFTDAANSNNRTEMLTVAENLLQRIMPTEKQQALKPFGWS